MPEFVIIQTPEAVLTASPDRAAARTIVLTVEKVMKASDFDVVQAAKEGGAAKHPTAKGPRYFTIQIQDSKDVRVVDDTQLRETLRKMRIVEQPSMMDERQAAVA